MPGVLHCRRLPGIREREVGEGKREMILQMRHLSKMQGLHAPGTAGDDELQRKGTICRLRTAGGPTTLTTEWARLIYGRGANGKEIKIDLHYSTLGEERGRDTVDPDKGFSEALHRTEVEIKMPDEG